MPFLKKKKKEENYNFSPNQLKKNLRQCLLLQNDGDNLHRLNDLPCLIKRASHSESFSLKPEIGLFYLGVGTGVEHVKLTWGM